jgi:Cysteine-rich CPXCG
MEKEKSMPLLETAVIGCPYCGENIEIVVDCSVSEQSYVEDCFVCCRPINIQVIADPSGEVSVNARHENE